MYKCNVCNKIFDIPDKTSAEDFYGVSDLFDYSCGKMIYMCPYCQETSFEEYIEEEDEDEVEE